ncbi:PKD repeat protein [Pseudarthrobacter defluvii]|uniref:PKD domain-containing protein n=1 Tax=Pseudarthrobacter defluvii TaxID=410837 RepID=UPI0027894D68|nr:PKD domain-containing protein [Pseudarthrobacter defluvii]MDQ0769288.1 PKD repeat protein [Pseudarthrobacter defluvii]
MKRFASWLAQTVVAAVVVAGSILVWSPAASADPVYGTQSISYSGLANPPTADKPQSKLWWNDGSWWADMWTTGSGWHIYRLDRGTHVWVDTGVLNDARGSTLADTLWDGTHLYIASHVVSVSSDTNPAASKAGHPAYLYRYSYVGGKYTLDPGFPSVITDNSSESLTIAEDSTGAIWATWTQVAGNATSGYTNTVYVNNSTPGGTDWAEPFVIPVTHPTAAPDDISAVLAYGKNKIGVMWSDQVTGTVWWATRTDGTSPTASSSWKQQYASRGSGQADDHLNLKSVQADDSGRVFAAVKTSLNDTSTDPTLPQLLLLVFKPGTGAFTKSTISTTGDCVTRPQILLDTQNNLVHVFQTAPPTSVTGCAYSGVAGSIYEKTAAMDNPTFGPGRGTPIMQSASSSNINDLTTTKQDVNGTTGIVVMATDNVAKNYWFADKSLMTATAPVASFTSTPSSGTAPLDVSFTDTSTGTPTSWAWDFGDGGTSNAQNPTHSYATAGDYTAKLTATNTSGQSVATTTITATAATPSDPGGDVPPEATTQIQAAADVSPGLGTATSPITCGLRDGGCYQNYQGGAIIWSPATGARVSVGAIRAAWAATGYENGGLGYPTTNEVCGLRGGGCYQNYQGGAIIWSPATGARVSVGAIRAAWAATGYENGGLGYPTTNEVCGLRGGGCYQNYQGGAIIWSPATGARVSVGAIRAAWAATGYENGGLGYPTTNEVCGLRGGGCYQNYQGGAIIWSPATGARVSVGAIRAAWAATGYENGGLGYPTTNEYPIGGGSVAQSYQGGRISWSPVTGTLIT